jgi:O-antigen ligase
MVSTAALSRQGITLHRVAIAASWALPVFLFYGRAIADILVTSIGLIFLLHSALSRDWAWTRRPWLWCALAFWLIQLAASFITGPIHSVLQALAVIRLFLLVAALESWVLPGQEAQRGLRWVFVVLAAWVVLEVWQQYAFGTNLLGYGRWTDGALTGPFEKPRAGAILVSLAVPVLFPMIIRMLQRASLASSALAAASFVLLLATMMLAGQRMPTLLMVLAMTLTGVLVPRLRRPLLIAAAVAIAALLALPVLSPPAYAKLVVKFAEQMSHFPDSPYGQLYVRAAVMVGMNPLMGLGFDGFRALCPNPEFFHALPTLGIVNTDIGAAACNIHPHNYYLEVAVMGGLAGLVAFVAMVVLWLRRLLLALHPSTDPDQAMLFVAFVTVFWPFASTSSLFTFDTAGWAMLITGWALAASRPAR